MGKSNKAVSWAISLRESQWAFINELAEKWGISRSMTVSLIVHIFIWQNGGCYEEALQGYLESLHGYMPSRVKGREKGVREE